MVTGDVEVRRSAHGDLQGLIARLNRFKNKEVLVGIPQQSTSRLNSEINNAELLYIHTHGSPRRNIPARPVIEPAIKHNQKKIMFQFEKATKAMALGKIDDAERYLITTGLAAQNAARDWFTNPANGWAANSPVTIALKGSSQPLIDTGALRKSIIYVVRDRE